MEIPQDIVLPSEEEKQVLSALSGGLISYIRTEGKSIDSVKKNAPKVAESQAWSDCLRTDLSWILDETNPLFTNPSLAFEDIAIALDLLERIDSLISGILNDSIVIKDSKLLWLLLYYFRLARAAIFAQSTLRRRKTAKKTVENIEEFLIQAGRATKSFFAEGSAEEKAMAELVKLYERDSNRNSYQWQQASKNYGIACAKRYLQWFVDHSLKSEKIIEITKYDGIDLFYRDRKIGLLFVLEARNGSSDEDLKITPRKKERQILLKHGTLEYLQDITQDMLVSSNPQERDIGRQIRKGIINKQLIYLGVNSTYAPEGFRPDTELHEPKLLFKSYAFDEPQRSEYLNNALPFDLQNRIPIVVDPTLSGNTVRVHYEVEEGLVANIHMKVGTEAKADDIKSHVPTVRLMERYSGLWGRIRLLLKRVQNWITRNGSPPIGSRAWEAKLEIEKLERIIKERLEREAKQGIDLVKAIALEEKIKELSQQLQRHQQTLDEMDTNPGVGYVAVEFKADSPHFSERVLETVKVIETRLQELPSSPTVSKLSQQAQNLKTRNSELIQAEESFILDDNPSLSAEDIDRQKQELISNLDKLEAELFHLYSQELSLKNSGLGTIGFTEQQQWYQDIVDTEKLIDFEPKLKEKYAKTLEEQRGIWLQVPENAQSDPNNLYSIIGLYRKDLIEIRNSIAPQLIQERNTRLNEIANELKKINPEITKLSRQQKHLQQGGRNTSNIDAGLNPLLTKRKQLLDEQTRLNNEIKSIKTLQQRAKPNPDSEKFAENITEQEVWQKLKQNHDSGSESSSSKFASVLIKEGIVSSEAEIVAYLGSINPGGQTLGKVRQQLKDNYRPQLLKVIDSQPTSELKYQKMRDIAENLDVREQGEFSEYWYQTEVANSRGVLNSTQVILDKTKADKEYGIELTTQKNRRFDEVYGDENSATIREHKHIKGKLGAEQIVQFDDNIKIVQHNYEIDTKTSQGIPLSQSKQDNPLIIEKDGKRFRPKKLMYTFATPEGVKANAKWMNTELKNNDKYLSFEIINSKGERKIVKQKNIKELQEPALSLWLYP